MDSLNKKKKGDGESFDANWRTTKEAAYLHWTRGEVQNQIQLAFRNHWHTFSKLLNREQNPGRVLEVGCGRGSLSAYFSDSGWDCTLIDISPKAIELAQVAFKENGLAAKFSVEDCLELSFKDSSFDAVFSIGLLEHFEDIGPAIAEQARILAPGGLFIGYVVPHLPYNVQKEYTWINEVIKGLVPSKTEAAQSQKTDIFRSDTLSPRYIEAMETAGLQDNQAIGIYPLPMISHSIEFPFSLMPADAEQALVSHFQEELDARRTDAPMGNPWLCEEGYGQAFLVWGRKPG